MRNVNLFVVYCLQYYFLRFILTMRNVNEAIGDSEREINNSFILTMRNVNLGRSNVMLLYWYVLY